MKDLKPDCTCQLDCSHHQPGECKQPATNWDDDRLCEECRDEKIRRLESELAKIEKEIADWEASHALMFKTGTSGERELEEEKLGELKTKRDKIAHELEKAKQQSRKK